MATESKHSAKPTAAAVEETRQRLARSLRRAYGEDAEDIAQEAVTRALESFDASRSVLFSAFATSIARNVAREQARAARRARGEPVERPELPEVWVEMFRRLPPGDFARWFHGAINAADGDTRLAAVVYIAHSWIMFVREAFDDWDDDWTDVYLALVDKATATLAAHPSPTAEDAAWAVLGAVGLDVDAVRARVRERDRYGQRVDKRVGQQSTLLDFLTERCRPDPSATTPAAALHDAYRRYCDLNAARPLTPSELAKLIGGLPVITRRRTKHGWVYAGIALLPEPPRNHSRNG